MWKKRQGKKNYPLNRKKKLKERKRGEKICINVKEKEF